MFDETLQSVREAFEDQFAPVGSSDYYDAIHAKLNQYIIIPTGNDLYFILPKNGDFKGKRIFNSTSSYGGRAIVLGVSKYKTSEFELIRNFHELWREYLPSDAEVKNYLRKHFRASPLKTKPGRFVYIQQNDQPQNVSQSDLSNTFGNYASAIITDEYVTLKGITDDPESEDFIDTLRFVELIDTQGYVFYAAWKVHKKLDEKFYRISPDSCYSDEELRLTRGENWKQTAIFVPPSEYIPKLTNPVVFDIHKFSNNVNGFVLCVTEEWRDVSVLNMVQFPNASNNNEVSGLHRYDLTEAQMTKVFGGNTWSSLVTDWPQPYERNLQIVLNLVGYDKFTTKNVLKKKGYFSTSTQPLQSKNWYQEFNSGGDLFFSYAEKLGKVKRVRKGRYPMFEIIPDVKYDAVVDKYKTAQSSSVVVRKQDLTVDQRYEWFYKRAVEFFGHSLFTGKMFQDKLNEDPIVKGVAYDLWDKRFTMGKFLRNMAWHGYLKQRGENRWRALKEPDLANESITAEDLWM